MSVFLKKLASALLSMIALLLSMQSAQAQTIFYEDFQDSMSFTTVDRDGRTPAQPVSYVTQAWVRRDDFDDETDTVAASTSWYDPVGLSDDWMISPRIHIDSQSVLIWDAKAQDAAYPDGYEVRISTTTTDIDSFLTSFALFNINGENPDWTTRYVNLASKGYANQDIYVAFRNTSNNMFLLLVDDVKVHNPYPVDARAVSIDLPPTSCRLGNAEAITVKVENFGLNPLTNLNVTYVINDGVNAPTVVTEIISNTINSLASLDYTFTQTADLSAPGAVYDITAYVSIASDADLNNDTLALARVINIAPADLNTGAYTSSFETLGQLLGWSIADDNNDGVSWFLAQNGANTGNLFFAYRFNGDLTTAADDWLFSTCIDLKAGTQYELSFFDKVGNDNGTVYNEKLKVAYGLNPDVASMDSIIEDLGELTNDFYQQDKLRFQVPANGTYYIGFHCYSDADKLTLSIDDISLAELVPPVPNFTTSKDELEVTFLNTSTNADSIYWNFGDGTNSTSSTVVHTYATPGTYNVCLTAVNEVGSATFCDSISVDTTTGIVLIDEAEFSIFPNPTQGAFVVQMNEQVIGKSILVVRDIVGKELLNTRVTNSRMQIDLSGTPEGVYFITLQAGESQLRRKIVLAH